MLHQIAGAVPVSQLKGGGNSHARPRDFIKKAKGANTMSSKDIESRAHELQELKRMKEELEAEITSLEDEIKAEMTARETDSITAGAYKIKWTVYESARFDSARFKKDHAELAAQYTKTMTARRFSIN
ncbi:MAG: hypothetical protein IJ662_09170 [Clostridia bacterium]|nr:hypothetical protein [Clostridia bacterium]